MASANQIASKFFNITTDFECCTEFSIRVMAALFECFDIDTKCELICYDFFAFMHAAIK